MGDGAVVNVLQHRNQLLWHLQFSCKYLPELFATDAIISFVQVNKAQCERTIGDVGVLYQCLDHQNQVFQAVIGAKASLSIRSQVVLIREQLQPPVEQAGIEFCEWIDDC